VLGGIAIGGLVTLSLGLTVRWAIDGLGDFRVETWRARMRKAGKSPEFSSEELFKELESLQGTDWPTWWLGVFERLLFFGALWVDAGVVVTGWLALKVASKWQSWVAADAAEERDVDRRVLLTEVVYLRFLIGTGMNLIFALIGLGVGRWFASSLAG
jgi:hypothetical protein